MRAALGMKNNVPTSEPGVKKQVAVPNASCCNVPRSGPRRARAYAQNPESGPPARMS